MLGSSSGSRSYSPMTVWVLPTSIARSITGGEATRRHRRWTNRRVAPEPALGGDQPGTTSRPMSSTGAEWVSAPIDTRSAPVVA